MAVSVGPALLSAGFAAAEAALNIDLVSYGPLVTNDPGDYLMLGVGDPDQAAAGEWVDTITHIRDWESVGIQADISEAGTIPCVALSWNGDGDVQLALETVYGIAEALIAVFRQLPNMGLIAVDWSLPAKDLTCETKQDNDGAKVRLKFTIQFQALV